MLKELFQRVDFDAPHGHCLHTPASKSHPHGKKKSTKLIDVDLVKSMQREARVKSSWPSDRVGYPEKDLRWVSYLFHISHSLMTIRPHSKANRAGTRGFRAPEVLLKCSDQTGGMHHRTLGPNRFLTISRKPSTYGLLG